MHYGRRTATQKQLISYERAFKKMANNMYITGSVKLLLSFDVGSGNHQRGISFRNFRKYEAHFTGNDVTSDKSQFPNIENRDVF